MNPKKFTEELFSDKDYNDLLTFSDFQLLIYIKETWEKNPSKNNIELLSMRILIYNRLKYYTEYKNKYLKFSIKNYSENYYIDAEKYLIKMSKLLYLETITAKLEMENSIIIDELTNDDQISIN
jgi:hypothetical protein